MDCSDLIDYFRNNRFPTGIQRVQINLAVCALSDEASGDCCAVVFYAPEPGTWHTISHLDFLSLVNAAAQSSEVDDASWSGIRNRLCTPSSINRFSFSDDDTLINLGTSWWIEDYSLQIRTLKFEKRVRYIPFAHDFIPLMAPEHCAETLSQQFRAALAGMLRNADGFLVNSLATARDLEKAARASGLPRPEIHVITLDGDTRAALTPRTPVEARAAVDRLLEDSSISAESVDKAGYALCVSTLESRKNHLLLFQAWDMMIARHGLEATPYLICVGKSGWLFDAPLAFLKSRPHLAERVKFLSSIDDASLAALYARAKFTVYPSFYEGWGLPITEALCFGKATACSNASSLPEAGGAFVEYFDLFAPREAFEVIDRLAFDDAHRKALEDKIARSYRARTWAQIAAQALDAVSAIVNRRASADEIVAPPPVEWNKLYFMTPRTSGTREVARSAEDIRLGGGWHRCEAWGAWTRTRRAMLRFGLAEPPVGAIALYVQLKGAVGRQVVRVSAAQSREAFEIDVDGAEPSFVRIVFTDGLPGTAEQMLVIESSKLIDLSEVTEGRDKRRVGCGFIQFGLCREADLTGRIAMLEAMSVGAGAASVGKT